MILKDGYIINSISITGRYKNIKGTSDLVVTASTILNKKSRGVNVYDELNDTSLLLIILSVKFCKNTLEWPNITRTDV